MAQTPNKAMLMTTAEVKALGWAGEARDSDGHLHSMTALRSDDDDMAHWISECVSDGLTVTFFAARAQDKGDG